MPSSSRKYQGRSARPEASSRIGQDWDTEIQPIFSRSGNNYTAEQYYRRFGNSTLGRDESPGTSYTSRKHCGQDLKLDNHGFAYCRTCFKVFNSGNPQDGDKPVSIPIIKEWGPPMVKRSRRRGYVGRATSAAP